MKKILAFSVLIAGLWTMGLAQDKHELEGGLVKIDAQDYRNGKLVDKVTLYGKSVIIGKSGVYNHNKPLKKAAAPTADFPFVAKAAGGDYKIIVYYRIDRNATKTDDNQIIVGFDEQETKELQVREKGNSGRVETDFSAAALRGKNHVVRIWLPTKGVAIDRIDVRRKL